MTLSNLFYRHPRLTLLVVSLILVSGLTSWAILPRLEDPVLLPRFATVTTRYPGAAPDRVESQVTEVIEEELEEVDEINVLSSDQFGEATTADAMKKSQQLLLRYGDEVDGVFAVCEPNCNGMLEALVQAGKAGQIAAIGFDGNEDLQAFVRDGTLNATLVQGSFQMGELGVKAVLDLIAGKTVEAQIDTGVVLVTKDNIDADEAKNVLY